MPFYPAWTAGQRVTAALLTAMQPLVVVKAANTSRTSTTTLADDPHLSLAVSASATYLVEGFIDYDGNFGGVGGLKIDFTVPALAVLRWGPFGNVAADTTQKYNATTNNTGFNSVASYGTGGSHTAANLKGYLTVAGTAGTLQMRWAQDTSNSTATTVYAGSWIRLSRQT